MIAALFAAVALGQATPKNDRTLIVVPKPGEKFQVHAPFGSLVPALVNRASFEKYMSASIVAEQARIRPAWGDLLQTLSDGCQVEVVETIERGSDKGTGGQRYLSNASVVLVKVFDKRFSSDATFWVPAPYFNKPNEPPHPALQSFPVLFVLPDTEAIPAPGAEMILYNDGDRKPKVPITTGLFEFADMAKACKAGDARGIKELEEKKKLLWVEGLTSILVIERHDNPFIANGVHAVEARLLDGPYKGKVFWIGEQYTAKQALHVLKYRDVERFIKGRNSGTPR
jgi:hypothetical protein